MFRKNSVHDPKTTMVERFNLLKVEKQLNKERFILICEILLNNLALYHGCSLEGLMRQLPLMDELIDGYAVEAAKTELQTHLIKQRSEALNRDIDDDKTQRDKIRQSLEESKSTEPKQEKTPKEFTEEMKESDEKMIALGNQHLGENVNDFCQTDIMPYFTHVAHGLNACFNILATKNILTTGNNTETFIANLSLFFEYLAEYRGIIETSISKGQRIIIQLDVFKIMLGKRIEELFEQSLEEKTTRTIKLEFARVHDASINSVPDIINKTEIQEEEKLLEHRMAAIMDTTVVPATPEPSTETIDLKLKEQLAALHNMTVVETEMKLKAIEKRPKPSDNNSDSSGARGTPLLINALMRPRFAGDRLSEKDQKEIENSKKHSPNAKK